MRFVEIYTRVQNRISDTSAATLAVIKDKVNETLEEIWSAFNHARWYYRTGSFSTYPRNEGTSANSRRVRVEIGNRLIFFTSGALHKGLIGADFKVAGDDNSYRITDIGLPGVTGRDLDGAAISSGWNNYALIDRPYEGSSSSGNLYTITQDRYRLRADVQEIAWITQMQSPQRLAPIEAGEFSWLIPDPHNFGATGETYWYQNLGRENIILMNVFSDDDFDGDAIAAVTQNSRAVTITGLDTAHESRDVMFGAGNADVLTGATFRVIGEDRTYSIQRGEEPSPYTSGAAYLVLEEPYKGTTNASAAFEIVWEENPVIQLYPVPTSTFRVNYGYYTKERELILDEDEPILPAEFHKAVIDGAMYRMLLEIDSNRAQPHQADYQAGIARIKRRLSLNTDRAYVLNEASLFPRSRVYNLGPNYAPLIRR